MNNHTTYAKHMARFNRSGKCCQREQFQVVAEPGLKVSVLCVVCGKRGPVADTLNEAVSVYRTRWNKK